MSEALPDPTTHLEPPTKTTEREDAGAGDSASDSDEDHFSDASEGRAHRQTSPRSVRTASPVPRTRVERVDNDPQHGEVPGTVAYQQRKQDAVPDEIALVPEGSRSRDSSPAGSQDRSSTPGGSPIPRTQVEKIDPASPSHGEVPGTEAFEKRQADAVPDIITKASDSDSPLPSPSADRASPDSNLSNQSIPETRLSRVDTIPADEELPSRPCAHQRSPSDALPDSVESIRDSPSVISASDTLQQPAPQNDTFEGGDQAEQDDQGFGDDFDEFVEEQDDMGDDDFGDFDDGFQEPEVTDPEPKRSITPQQPPSPVSVPSLIDFDNFKSTSELLSALQDTLDTLLPSSTDLNSLPPVESIPDSSAIFSTERSLSLWSQLVAPPPLQPQNWVKSRIRRLFLVSLGVPVDLDEILPASKQNKLILPSIDLDAAGSKTPTRNPPPKGDASHPDSLPPGQASARSKTGRRGTAPAPELDLSSVRRLCATTDAALSGLTDDELKQHVTELEQVTLRASAVLEYWLKRRDGLVGEKEAFEGVIENLVSHVRRVRK
ncbi:hypothetical protein N7462_010435 [Penicillium macrosclerotiorum]|uniref:uncharacterized protein n=1 Tax=Penicillium macrosclerotiorum TaxID=303699 RepID=UPI002547DF92|nr:uncharacterized protein N7462_010435 [Penicillium macrosclerotiorum]KAJ5669365.1 hypothetical protein N7462_010435 [Penicillium macrosclerotiorum]